MWNDGTDVTAGSDVMEELASDYEWIESYNLVKAEETVAKLFQHWTRYRKSLDTPQDEAELLEESDSGSDQMDLINVTSPNTVCSHEACSALSVCYIHHLSLVKSHYHGGKTDTFRIKAIDKAIRSRRHINCVRSHSFLAKECWRD